MILEGYAKDVTLLLLVLYFRIYLFSIVFFLSVMTVLVLHCLCGALFSVIYSYLFTYLFYLHFTANILHVSPLINIIFSYFSFL